MALKIQTFNLDLVFNPGGASLPGDQHSLELDYKRELQQNFGIAFNQLFTINKPTNKSVFRFSSCERTI